jgi:hypothetical protein
VVVVAHALRWPREAEHAHARAAANAAAASTATSTNQSSYCTHIRAAMITVAAIHARPCTNATQSTFSVLQLPSIAEEGSAARPNVTVISPILPSSPTL